jgi:hypothetical protein
MFSKEFQEWNSLTTHKSDSTWRTDVLSAIHLAIVMPLVWASWFQFFIIVLSLLKLNSTPSQLLHDPHVLITAMCCATRSTIAAWSSVEALPTVTVTFAAELAFMSLLLHVLEVNKVMAGVVMACTLFKAIVLQIRWHSYPCCRQGY